MNADQQDQQAQSAIPDEALVAVFADSEQARRAAASLRTDDLNVRRVSRKAQESEDELPHLVYDDVEEVSSDNATTGMMKGGAIGAGSGLIFLGVPGLNIVAPIVGGIVGAWIGSVAGVDEAIRGKELPDSDDYEKMLAAGKSFVVVAGNESARIELGNRLQKIGAEQVHQHPPVLQSVRSATATND